MRDRNEHTTAAGGVVPPPHAPPPRYTTQITLQMMRDGRPHGDRWQGGVTGNPSVMFASSVADTAVDVAATERAWQDELARLRALLSPDEELFFRIESAAAALVSAVRCQAIALMLNAAATLTDDRHVLFLTDGPDAPEDGDLEGEVRS